MAEKKGATPWLPLLAGIGLIGGGLYLWSQSNPDGDGGIDLRLDAERTKWQHISDYSDLIYADNRVPTDSDLTTMNNWIDLATRQEITYQGEDRARWMEALADFMSNLGFYVIIPAAVGFSFYAVWQGIKRWRQPPSGGTPCGKCGYVSSSPEDLQNHTATAHTVTDDPYVLGQANVYWQAQPSMIKGCVGAHSGMYSLAFGDLSYWGASLSQGMSSMSFNYALGMGSAGSMASMAPIFLLCLV